MGQTGHAEFIKHFAIMVSYMTYSTDLGGKCHALHI